VVEVVRVRLVRLVRHGSALSVKEYRLKNEVNSHPLGELALQCWYCQSFLRKSYLTRLNDFTVLLLVQWPFCNSNLLGVLSPAAQSHVVPSQSLPVVQVGPRWSWGQRGHHEFRTNRGLSPLFWTRGEPSRPFPHLGNLPPTTYEFMWSP
jgi:hypothetical protein